MGRASQSFVQRATGRPGSDPKDQALFLDVRGAPVLALDAPHDRGLTVVRRPGPLPRLRRFSKRRQRSVRLLP
jgi:hypothetical protein